MDGRAARAAARGLVVVLALLAGVPSRAAEPGSRVAIRGGVVWPGTAPPIERGVILVEGGRIRAVGRDLEIPPGYEVLDARGGHVVPGIVAVRSILGLQGARGDDVNEPIGSCHPEIEAFHAIDPFHPDFSLVRGEGVTSVHVAPGDASVIGGRGTVVKTAPGVIDRTVVKRHASMVFSLAARDDDEGIGAAERIRRELRRARRYDEDRRRSWTPAEPGEGSPHVLDARIDPIRPVAPVDPGLDGMLPLLRGEMVAIFRCETLGEIVAALDIAREFGLRAALHGAAEAHRVADALRRQSIPVIAGPLRPDGGASPGWDPSAEVARLVREGIVVAIVADEENEYRSASLRFLLLDAALAMAGGLDEVEALRLITIDPARVLGIDDRVGSLEPGKDADLLVLRGPPFELRSVPVLVMIDGVIVARARSEERLAR